MRIINSKFMKPIFIVGMNGSGTTMLADCLNNHPDIFIPKNESRIIPYYHFNIAKYGNLENENNFKTLVRNFCEDAAFWIHDNLDPEEIPIDFDRLIEKNLSSAINITFSYFAKKENKTIWGDHSPKYTLCLPVITDLFPKAKIIHIIRDGRDCTQSFARRFKLNSYKSIYDWKILVRQARKDGIALGKERYFEIKYEDLTKEPEENMRNISFFIEVPFNQRTLVSKMPYSNGNNTDKKTIVKNSEKWKTYFTQKQIRKLERISGSTLKNLGYEILYEDGDQDLSAHNIYFLKWIDRIRTSLEYHKSYKGKNKYIRFIKYASNSWKQSRFKP